MSPPKLTFKEWLKIQEGKKKVHRMSKDDKAKRINFSPGRPDYGPVSRVYL